jgi:putative glutamine amidotransferase
MKRPVIGITVDTHNDKPYYESPFAYAHAIEKAGGLPLLMPYKTDPSLVPQYVDLFDGILFSGGNDLDPAPWGETVHPKTVPIDPLRERWERALIAEVERRRTPMMGICLGSQLMNVYRGGSMTQFIPEHKPGSLEHRKTAEPETRHSVTVDPESTLGRIVGKREVLANSSHKQCMNKIGRGLRVTATAPDGIVEGLEDPTFPLFIAVQWHPERLTGEEDHEKLFRHLVEKAREGK